MGKEIATAEKILMVILRAAEGSKRAQSGVLRKYDLSFSQYNILRVLESAPGHQKKISGVSKELLVHVANMTRLVKRLEREGYIERMPDPTDDRVTILQLTQKGTTTLERVKRDKDENLAKILDGVPTEDRTTVLRVAKRVIQNCRGRKAPN